MSDNSLTPAQLQTLLEYASKRLGTTPEKLIDTYQSGGLTGIASQLNPTQASKLESMVGDKTKAEQLLQSPQVQQVIQQLLNNLNNK